MILEREGINSNRNTNKIKLSGFKIGINRLPLETIPFYPAPTPRKNLKPIGQKPFEKQLKEEKYLHKILNFIAEKNPQMFTGKLKPENFRFVYSESLDKTANADLSNLTITVSPKFFNNLQNSAQAVAILCHEASHFILGHNEFIQPPNIVRENKKFIKQNLLLESATKNLQLEKTAEIFKQFDDEFKLVKDRFRLKCSDEIESLLEKRKTLSGKESNDVFDQIKKRLEIFARADDSIESKKYLEALDNYKTYHENLQKWQDVKKGLSEIIGEILGEKNASLNWQEAEADILGFRMFVKSGFDPNDFTKILAKTLDNGDGKLMDYLEKINRLRDYTNFEFPPRGEKVHPSPEWRIANLAIRELKLRHPSKYKKIIDNQTINI